MSTSPLLGEFEISQAKVGCDNPRQYPANHPRSWLHKDNSHVYQPDQQDQAAHGSIGKVLCGAGPYNTNGFRQLLPGSAEQRSVHQPREDTR